VDERDRYLVETYTLTYLTSGRDLLRLQTQAPSRQQPVIIANPDFDHPGNSELATRASSSRGAENRRSTDSTSLKFGSLPGAAAEAAALARLLPEATLLTESQATENALKQVQSPRILHLATHGFFLSDLEPALPLNPLAGELMTAARPPVVPTTENPLLRSGLALAGFNLRQSGSEDGVLTALEAAGLDLQGTELVVLSACDTGVGEIANGEGVYGLRRALTIAGARSQLMSLWQVADIGTDALMVDYYHRLLQGEGRSEALRQAQLALRQDPQYCHPYYWAAFIFQGDWTGTPLRQDE
jgi:CHAT domain-containing protein